MCAKRFAMENIELANKLITENGIVLIYSGFISQDVIESVGKNIQREMENSGHSKKAAHNLITIFIEMSQNILHHGLRASPEVLKAHQCTLALGKDEENYFVACSSIMPQKEQSRLESRLTELSNASEEELAEKYRQQRRQGRNETEKNNAGLGLLTVARKTSAPLWYRFRSLGDSHSLFTLKAIV